MAKQKRKVRKQQPPRKRRDPRQGDSSLGLPGVLDMTEFHYQRGYRYTSGVALLGRRPDP